MHRASSSWRKRRPDAHTVSDLGRLRPAWIGRHEGGAQSSRCRPGAAGEQNHRHQFSGRQRIFFRRGGAATSADRSTVQAGRGSGGGGTSGGSCEPGGLDAALAKMVLIAVRAGYDTSAVRRLSPRQLVAIAKAEAQRDRDLIGHRAVAARASQADRKAFDNFMKDLSA